MEVLQPFTKKIPSFSFEEYKGGVKFRNGDTIMARITPSLENGKTSYVDILDENEIGFGSTEFIVFREKENISDKHFIYYLTTSPIVRNTAIKSMTGSSGRQRVQTDVVKEHLFDAPPLPEQRAIAEVLSSLDDKIDLLHRQNKTLEQMAETLFRQWFVEEAKGDWEEFELGKITYIKAGGDKPKIFSNTKTENFNIPIYSNGINNEGLYGYTNKAKITSESITISARGTIGYVCLRQEPYFPIVRLISIVPNESFVSSKYLYLWAKSQNISGTGTTQQQLTVPEFSRTKLIIPPIDIMNEFTMLVNVLFNKMQFNKTQIRTLEKLRDTLLPKLMSGEVRVNFNDFKEEIL